MQDRQDAYGAWLNALRDVRAKIPEITTPGDLAIMLANLPGEDRDDEAARAHRIYEEYAARVKTLQQTTARMDLLAGAEVRRWIEKASARLEIIRPPHDLHDRETDTVRDGLASELETSERGFLEAARAELNLQRAGGGY